MANKDTVSAIGVKAQAGLEALDMQRAKAGTSGKSGEPDPTTGEEERWQTR